MPKTNAEICRAYYYRKRNLTPKTKCLAQTNAERCKAYRLRKKKIAQEHQSSDNEILPAITDTNLNDTAITNSSANYFGLKLYLVNTINTNETLDDNLTMEFGFSNNEISEDSNNDLVEEEIRVKEEPINYENIKVEKELQTELIIKNEPVDDEVTMEFGNEKPEDGVKDLMEEEILVKEESIVFDPVEKEFHTEVIIKDEIIDEEETILESQQIHTENRRNQSFLCNICHKIFNRRCNLVQHKRVHSEEKLSCNICNKTFTQQFNLVRHKLIHSGEKPFVCDVCNKTFNQKTHLDQHKRIHSGKKPFSCDICRKKFNQKPYLVLHKRIHIEERQFSCDVCNKKFHQKRNLIRHKRIHTEERQFSCDVCNKQFHQKANLIHHKRIHNRPLNGASAGTVLKEL